MHIAPIGLRPREHEHALVPASALLEVPRKQRELDEVLRRARCSSSAARAGLTGAPMLAALAAFRADAGYVAVAAPESTLPVLEARLLEVVKQPLPEDSAGHLLPRAADAILEAAEKADVVAIGPGLGRTEGTVELVRILLERLELPVVLDADALWELEPFTRAAPDGAHAAQRRARAAARRRRRARSTRTGSTRCGVRRRRFGSVVLLKGADTLVAAPREGVLVATYGTPAARDRRHRRRADGHRRGVPREGARAAARRGDSRPSPTASPPSSSSRRPGSIASDLLPGSSSRSPATAWQRAPLQ